MKEREFGDMNDLKFQGVFALNLVLILFIPNISTTVVQLVLQ